MLFDGLAGSNANKLQIIMLVIALLPLLVYTGVAGNPAAYAIGVEVNAMFFPYSKMLNKTALLLDTSSSEIFTFLKNSPEFPGPTVGLEYNFVEPDGTDGSIP